MEEQPKGGANDAARRITQDIATLFTNGHFPNFPNWLLPAFKKKIMQIWKPQASYPSAAPAPVHAPAPWRNPHIFCLGITFREWRMQDLLKRRKK
jgi:hypothetical protein